MLVDSHCHLDFPDFEQDMPLVLQRAEQSGIGIMQTISTRLSQFSKVLELTEKKENLYCSIGTHPHNVKDEWEFKPDEIVRQVSANEKVIGIGETGLDYFYDNSPKDLQRASFIAHIEVSRRTGIPVIIHSRSADQDTMRILKDETENGRFPGLIHCFTGGRELAMVALECGLLISLSGIITFKNADKLRDVACSIPRDRLLLETDSPFLAPIPCRGKRNEPSFLRHTAEFVAEMLKINVNSLADETTENFFRLFKRAVRPEEDSVSNESIGGTLSP